jgi:propanol-preferring alcohol dehydrogenase
VVAVDIGQKKLDLARYLGAEIVLDATKDPAQEIQRLIGGAHGVLVTAVSPEAFRQSIDMLRPRGTCALVGLPPGVFSMPIFEVVLKRLTIRGSIVGTRMDLQEALTLAASGKVRSAIERQPLEAINDVFDRIAPGRTQRPRGARNRGLRFPVSVFDCAPGHSR